MPHRYLQALSTPSVLAARERYGSRTSIARLIDGCDTNDRLGPDEIAFVAARDGFYLATAAENGWPYVQYRGGPPGFLQALDDTTLGWADFRGNRQYLSVGNLGATPQAALFLMDYAARQRLKVLGTVEVLDARDAGAGSRTARCCSQLAAAEQSQRMRLVR